MELDDKALKKSISDKGLQSFLLIDRSVVKDFEEEDIHRLSDSIGTAFYEGEGEMQCQ